MYPDGCEDREGAAEPLLGILSPYRSIALYPGLAWCLSITMDDSVSLDNAADPLRGIGSADPCLEEPDKKSISSSLLSAVAS